MLLDDSCAALFLFLVASADFLPTGAPHKSPAAQVDEADLIARLNEGLSAQAPVNLSSSMHSQGLVRLNDGRSGAGTSLFADAFRR